MSLCLIKTPGRMREKVDHNLHFLINEVLIVLCTKWWDLVTWRLRSLRSCHASIIKGCRLCFSSSHHCSDIKLCGHSPLQHLRDRRCPSITTTTCQCQQFCAGFCWGCHTNCSCNFVCAASIMCASKRQMNLGKTSFLLSEYLQFLSEVQRMFIFFIPYGHSCIQRHASHTIKIAS